MSEEAARPDGPSLARCPHCGGEHGPHLLKCPDTDLVLPLEGRVLHGKFQFIRQLGRGGMASVWAAINTSVDRPVAIKLIRPEVGRNEETVARFRSEAKAAGRIAHPNVCDILDFGVGPRGPYIIMERLRGQSLGQLIHARGRLDPSLTAGIVRQALAGLDAAHRRGIIHRDLKPENLFVHQPEAGPPVVKIMDFGVSKLTDGSAEVQTEHGVLLGTPEYMSPEQFKGAAQADVRTDIWAVGAILYKALTGRTAFAGPSVAATLLMVTSDPPKPIPELVRGVPHELVALVERCLSKDPDERFQSAQELADELEPFDLDSLSTLELDVPDDDLELPSPPTLEVGALAAKKPRDADERGGPQTDLPTTRPRSTPPPRTVSRPDRRAWLLIAVATVLGAGVMYMLATSSEHRASEASPTPPTTASAEVPTASPTPTPTPTPTPASTGPQARTSDAGSEGATTGATTHASDDAAAIEVASTSGASGSDEIAEIIDATSTSGFEEGATTGDEDEPTVASSGGSTGTNGTSVDPSVPPPTPPGTLRVGRYLTLEKPGPTGTHTDARNYCRNLGTHAFVGVTEWKLASPTTAKKLAAVVKKGKYWTSALWRDSAIVISLPSKHTDSRAADKAGPRALCVARWP